jgi:tRNA-dihydrouridine synthase B
VPDPTLAQQKAILLEHYQSILDHFGTDAGLRLARKHVAWYSRGLPGSAEFRAVVTRLVDVAAVHALIAAFYDPLIERGIARQDDPTPMAEAA